jgi:hypothetical protein
VIALSWASVISPAANCSAAAELGYVFDYPLGHMIDNWVGRGGAHDGLLSSEIRIIALAQSAF